MVKDSSIYLCSARLLTELVTLEDEKRKVRYLSPYAPGPSVAQQVAGVIIIGVALANMARDKNKNVSVERVTDLLLWHDAPETRYGDLGRDQRKYLYINEEKALTEMFGSVPWGLEIIELIENFEKGGRDINTKIARDADALYVISTIKETSEAGFPVNQPEVRIQKTLNRLATEDGYHLGNEMAEKSPREIWYLIYNLGKIDGKKTFPPAQSLFTKLATIWVLTELENKTRKVEVKREEVMQAVIRKERKMAISMKNLISDSEKIYRLISMKKMAFAKQAKKKMRFSVAGLKTAEAKKLAQAIDDIDLFDWWNLMMGYASLNPDGTLSEKMR